MRAQTAVLTALVTLATASAAPARIVENRNVVTPSGLVNCYANIPVAGGGITCATAYALPLSDASGEGDPVAALKQRGRAEFGRRSDYSGFDSKRVALRYGDTWKRPGIRCTLRVSGLTCRNLDAHGFVLARGRSYRF